MDSLNSINYQWLENYLATRPQEDIVNNIKDKVNIEYLTVLLKEAAVLSKDLKAHIFVPEKSELASLDKIRSVVEKALGTEDLRAFVETRLSSEQIMLLEELPKNSLPQPDFYSAMSRTKFDFIVEKLSSHVDRDQLEECCRIFEKDIRTISVYYELVNADSKIPISNRITEINAIQKKLGAQEFFAFFDKHTEKSVDAVFALYGLEKDTTAQLVRIDLEARWTGLNNLKELVRYKDTPLFKELVLDDSFRDHFLRAMNTFPTDVTSSIREEVRKSMISSTLSLDAIKDIFTLASGNPVTTLILLKEYREAKEVVDTAVLMGSPSFASGISSLIAAEGTTLSHAKTLVLIAKTVSLESAEKCLETWKVGEHELFNHVLANFEKQDSPFDKFLNPKALCENPQDPHLLAALIKIKSQTLIAEILKEGIHSINASLIKLETLGETKVVEKILIGLSEGKTTTKETSVLKLLQSGEIDLAVSFMKKWDKKLALRVSNIPEVYRSPAILRQVYMIERDLKALKIENFPFRIPESESIEKIEAYLTNVQLWLIECNENPEKKSRFQPYKNIKDHIENRFENSVEGLIKCLMTPSGEFPPSTIAILRETPTYQRFLTSCPGPQKVQITLFLDALSTNASMPVRIGSIRKNENLSSLLQIKDPTQRDVIKALYSALMTPTRQHPKIGSCFATSLAILQSQSKAGLMQTFEDYLSLIKEQKLVRTEDTVFGPLKKIYPAIAFNRQKVGSDEVPYLSRVREMTMAGMGGAKAKEELILKSVNLILKGVEGENKEVSQKIMGWMDTYTRVIFRPLAEKNDEGKWVDVWQLQEGETSINTPEAMMDLYERCLGESLTKNMDSIADERPWQLISEGSSERLMTREYTQKDQDLLENRHLVFGSKDLLKTMVDYQLKSSREIRKGSERVNVSSLNHAFTYMPRPMEALLSKGDKWYQTFLKDHSIDRGEILKKRVIEELLIDLKKNNKYSSFMNSTLLNSLINKEMTKGAFWSDFKDMADVWGFSPIEKKYLLDNVQVLLFNITKNANPLILFDENYTNFDIVAFPGLSGDVLFLQRYEYEPGKFAYIKPAALGQEPMINLPEYPYIPHEFNIKRAF